MAVHWGSDLGIQHNRFQVFVLRCAKASSGIQSVREWRAESPSSMRVRLFGHRVCRVLCHVSDPSPRMSSVPQ
jgi:hypothetical protein